MSEAITAAELALSRALAQVWRAHGPEEELKARARVVAAEEALARAKANPIGEDQQQCCGMPMVWANGGWLCAIGHD